MRLASTFFCAEEQPPQLRQRGGWVTPEAITPGPWLLSQNTSSAAVGGRADARGRLRKPLTDPTTACRVRRIGPSASTAGSGSARRWWRWAEPEPASFDRPRDWAYRRERRARSWRNRSQPIFARKPLAARKRGRSSVLPYAAARRCRRRKAGVSSRSSRRRSGRRRGGSRSWREQVRDLGGRETRSSVNGGARRKRGAARALIVNDRR
jgi:hypothetical protein